MRSTCLALAFLSLVLLAFPASAQNADHGAQRYKLCAGCHGFRAQGNQAVHAPALAGQEGWYLERQIRNFRDGIRGHGGDDPAGQSMAQMTRGLEGDEAIRDIVAYIETLPSPRPDATVSGDVEQGRNFYATCAACHGAGGEGSAALNAPALKSTDDWYQLAQLRKFKAGIRGAATEDVYGQQMAPMVTVLSDDQAMRDVVAYISSL